MKISEISCPPCPDESVLGPTIRPFVVRFRLWILEESRVIEELRRGAVMSDPLRKVHWNKRSERQFAAMTAVLRELSKRWDILVRNHFDAWNLRPVIELRAFEIRLAAAMWNQILASTQAEFEALHQGLMDQAVSCLLGGDLSPAATHAIMVTAVPFTGCKLPLLDGNPPGPSADAYSICARMAPVGLAVALRLLGDGGGALKDRLATLVIAAHAGTWMFQVLQEDRLKLLTYIDEAYRAQEEEDACRKI